MLASRLSYILKGFSFLAKIHARQLEELVHGLFEFYQRKGGLPNSAEMAKKIKSSLSRKTRKALDPMIATYLERNIQIDYEKYMIQIEEGAFRTGLLFSNSLKASLTGLKEYYQLQESLKEILKKNPLFQRFILYGISSEYLALRKSLGLSV